MSVVVAGRVTAPTRLRSFLRIVSTPKVAVPLATLLVLIVVALFSSVIAPFGEDEQNINAVFQGPSRSHWLGTDGVGRDQLSRLLIGMRTSLVAAFQAVGLAAILGVPTGLLAGYRGGWPDTVASRINDSIMSIPGLVLALTVVAVIGAGLTNAMLAVGVVLAPMLFRIGRAAALDVRQQTYIEAAQSIGCRSRRILWRHVAPNASGPLIVQISLLFGYAIVAESSLSYLGLGVQPPQASLGSMLALANTRLDLTYLLYAPGLALCILVLAFILLGYALRDILSSNRKVPR